MIYTSAIDTIDGRRPRRCTRGAMITVRNLTKQFGDVVAVRDASFDVHAGEVMGFLGPNGAGKSTTLRILAGYLPATGGTVEIAGHDVLAQPLAVKRRIGYLPENVPLYPEMRVEEYLRFRARLKEVPRTALAAAVERSIERSALAEVRRRLVGQLSKGYRQRVGLADALVADPPILILDEPTGGLDPHQRREVLDLIRALGDQHTILLSSHVLAEIETISTRVMIIQRGRLLAVGAPRELATKLQESPTIVAEVRAEPARIEAALEPLRALLVEPLEIRDLEDGWRSLRLAPAPDRDPRQDLAQALADAGLPLRELRRRQFTLEELFMQITAQAATEEEVRP